MSNDYLNIPIPETARIERVVLADLIITWEAFGDVVNIIHKDFFTSDLRKNIWDYMQDCYNRGEEVEITNLSIKFPGAIKNELGEALATAGGALSPISHANDLRNAAAGRRAAIAAMSFVQDNSRPGITEQEIFANAEKFSRQLEGPAPLNNNAHIAEVLTQVKDNMDKTAQLVKEGKTIRITTGFYFMDEVFNGGFKAGQLVILAARPSIGKTALMLQMAKSATLAGNPALIFSLEMQKEELAERLMYSTELIRPYQVAHGEVEAQVFEKVNDYLSPLPLYINDFSRSLDEIISRLTIAVKKGRCKIAFIDYLGLISDALNFGNAKLYQVIARITGTLKAVAKRLEIPIVLLCQLNRDAARQDREPELYDLRDSGSIEQDADIVMMLHKGEYIEVSSDKTMSKYPALNIHLRKNRGGKKEITFVAIPNDTYSGFKEGNPLMPDELKEEKPKNTPENAAATPEPIVAEEFDDNLPF